MDRRPATALTIAAASFLGLGLTACNGTATAEPTPNETTIFEPQSEFADDGTTTPPAEPDVPDAQPLGGSYTYNNGVTLSVTEVGAGTVDDAYSSLPEGTVYPIFEFTIINSKDSATPVDPTQATITVNYGDQGLPAESISYMGDGTSYMFEGTVLPGMANSIRTGYLVPEGEPVVITFAPDWEASPAVFTR